MKCSDCGLEMKRLSEGYVCEQCASIKLDSEKRFMVTIPTKVWLRKDKKGKDVWFSLNINQYRNTNHYNLSKAKVNYAAIVKPMLANCPKFSKINLSFTLYTSSRRKCDTNNVLSVVEKFFSDCLVDLKIIEDDNYNFIHKTEFVFGGIDLEAEESYVIVKIEEQ